MRVHVRRSHAARLVRFVAHGAHERPFAGVHSGVYGEFAGLRKGFATVLAYVAFALGMEDVVAERLFREELFVCEIQNNQSICVLLYGVQ